ncbi:hypothetical protein [Hoeflea sp.]|uniref:hypothetical protein n=1 Tax=Hoeflea sp. TaxID=1940281 RepID=UPI003B0288CC
MADDIPEKPDFESLLRTGFRWPTEGDAPFTQSENWEQNAYIDRFGHGRIVMMMAGDLMVAQVARDRHDGDVLVFPVVFNYRQFIELSLKFLIATYGHTVGIKAEWNTHDLKSLWETFLKVLEGYGHDDAEGAAAIVEEIILEFAKVDPRSFSYRYPVDTKSNPVLPAHQEIDFHRLADVMHGLDGYFSGCDGYLDDLQKRGRDGKAGQSN